MQFCIAGEQTDIDHFVGKLLAIYLLIVLFKRGIWSQINVMNMALSAEHILNAVELHPTAVIGNLHKCTGVLAGQLGEHIVHFCPEAGIVFVVLHSAYIVP